PRLHGHHLANILRPAVTRKTGDRYRFLKTCTCPRFLWRDRRLRKICADGLARKSRVIISKTASTNFCGGIFSNESSYPEDPGPRSLTAASRVRRSPGPF